MTKQTNVPENLLRFIREGTVFIVAGHKEPDGDCVGSQLALVSALRRIGKKALACTAGPFKRSEIKSFENRFDPFPERPQRETRFILMDCSSLERTGGLSAGDMPMAVVDHHEREHSEGEAAYVEPGAPSVTYLTLNVIEALGLTPTQEEAQLLLFGLCTDTGFFRHLDEGSGEVFLAAARLAAYGASPKKAFAAINGGKTLTSRLLTGQVLSRTRAFYGGRLLLSFEEYEDIRHYGGESRDSDLIYQLLMAVEGVEAAVLIRQEKPDTCTMGLRSRERINVAAIAALFGGGGHKNAGGASIEGKAGALEERVVKAFEPFFNEN
jgi:phosphoesterase RecJ-like protein